MNITLIETEDMKTIERITMLLIRSNYEYVLKPKIRTANDFLLRGTCFVVFCSRTNHELYELEYHLSRNRDNIFEIRGIADSSCSIAKKSTIRTRYEGRLFNSSGKTDISNLVS